MVSLALKLKQTQTFTNLGTLQTLIDTAKQYVALDSGFDLLSLASDAQRLAGGNITFQTLPIEKFGTIDGQSVNIVDQTKIAAIVQNLINPPTATATPAPTATSSSTASAAPTPAPTSQTYTNSQQPMESGVLPCVN
jgi:anionic cell wall polymer biosynthesis LytR-Cps2A-Psr (LCP) family protein